MVTQIENVSIDTVFEWLIDKIKNDTPREQLAEMLLEHYVDCIDNQSIIEMYEMIGGNLEGYKVIE